MDPISQGVVGALWAASLAPKHKLKPTLIAGALAGMAADLDVLISSSTDPLLFLEYHRQFTHSLIFVPIGALIVALCLWPFLKRSLQPKELLTACFLGYLSHGLLDACTTYGTQLLWPFTDDRVAWNVISIVDGKPRHGVLSCLGGLHNLELLVNLHVHVVLGVNVGDFVLDTSFTFFTSRSA